MYEQDLLPRVHVEEINRYVDLLLVPCRMNLETFREAGVEAPIRVLHHGIDSDAFPLLERPERPMFTFGTLGQQNVRKGLDVLLRAFQDEFRRDEPVRLIFKSANRSPWLRSEDPRVEFRSGFLDQAALLEYLRELDAFVLPSRGEGFGLCGLEAMATGLPLIATNWSGPVEYLDPDDSFPLAYHLVPTDGMPFGAMRLFGNWAEPSYEHLRELLRYLYEHPDLARLAGERASRRIHRDWQWDRFARQLVDDIDLLAMGVSPAL
jgi:glycosyltransferase involved in cell wall biosynthesis